MNIIHLAQTVRAAGGVAMVNGYYLYGSIPVVAEVRGTTERMDIPFYLLVHEDALPGLGNVEREMEQWAIRGYAAGIIRHESEFKRLVSQSVNRILTKRFSPVFQSELQTLMYVVSNS